jgi:hypothetical protein
MKMSSSRGQWQSLLAAVALLVLGAALGVSADRLHHRSSDADRLAVLERIRADPVGELDRVVKLSADQRQRIAAIMDTRQADIDAAWLNARVQLHATLDSVISEIAAVLDPDQVEAFREHVTRVHGPAFHSDSASDRFLPPGSPAPHRPLRQPGSN